MSIEQVQQEPISWRGHILLDKLDNVVLTRHPDPLRGHRDLRSPISGPCPLVPPGAMGNILPKIRRIKFFFEKIAASFFFNFWPSRKEIVNQLSTNYQ